MATGDNTVLMEGVKLVFRNFAGKEDQYNKEGDRNFAVLLDETVAKMMAEDGWNVKWLKPREDVEDDEQDLQAYLPVSIKFDVFPPNVVLVTSGNRTHLDESTVEMLDYAEIVEVDLIVRPYTWTVQGKTGIKAYVKTMFVTIEEDPLVRKYNELADAQKFPG